MIVAVPWDSDHPPAQQRAELTLRRLEITYGIPEACVVIGTKAPSGMRSAYPFVFKKYWDGFGHPGVGWFEDVRKAIQAQGGNVAVVGPTQALQQLFERPDLESGYPAEIHTRNKRP